MLLIASDDRQIAQQGQACLGEALLIILGQDIWLGGTVTGAGTDTGTSPVTGTGTGTGTGERVTSLRHC